MPAFLFLCAQPATGPTPWRNSGEKCGRSLARTHTDGGQNWNQVEPLQAAVTHSGLPYVAEEMFSDLADANFSAACTSGGTTWHLMILFSGLFFFFKPNPNCVTGKLATW